MNRVTQVGLAAGALGVAVIVGLGAFSQGSFGQPRQTPRPTALGPAPPVTFTTPDGWVVGKNDAVVTLGRAPTQSTHSVATITVCRDAYAVKANGELTLGLETDAATITFSLLKRADLREVISPREATLGGLKGYYLDFTIPASSELGRDVDTWVARSQQGTCLAVFDTSPTEDAGVGPGIQIAVPTIARLGLFNTPDGGNLMVLIASQGIGSRGVPDKADIEEATGIVTGFTFHSAPQ